MREVLTISKLNAYIKAVIENDTHLQYVEVRGEIINLKRYPNAVYFTLKEGDTARLSAVTFNPSSFPKELKDGDEIVASGRLSVYPKSGSYQLIVIRASYYGLGAKLVALAALKAKLDAQGLFDPRKKVPLPRFPRAIGLIVPKDSAAQSDVITNITRRYPLVTLKIMHATFQGENAPASLIQAFEVLNSTAIDILIIARGGGSSDDLWAFNDEKLILALSQKKMPLISAIGHEIDTTLVDYLADVRASTPTAAAELSVPDQHELRQDILLYEKRLGNALQIKYQTLLDQTKNLSERPVLTNFSTIIQNQESSVKELRLRLSAHIRATLNQVNEALLVSNNRLESALIARFTRAETNLDTLSAKLSNLNPRSVLSRGYAFISRQETIITKASDLSTGDSITLHFNDGTRSALVEGEEDERK